MKIFLLVFTLFIGLRVEAQTSPGKLSFALPSHPGALTLDQGKFEIKELSAKPNQHELGIRAEDGDLHFLGFLFVWPEKPHLTSAACRDEMLASEGGTSKYAAADKSSQRSASGADIALVLLLPAGGKYSTVRAFVASGELCADLSFSVEKPIRVAQPPMEKIKAILNSLTFAPDAPPTFLSTFLYATIAWDHHELQGAIPAYRSALKLVDASDDPLKWRRVVTDQLSMALGMSGDLKASRAVNQDAIAKDPDYPLYYYNLACADAESGDASAARQHLEQAFARKTHTIPGETMPDPSTDDSFIKLKSNKEFWAFVQSLH